MFRCIIDEMVERRERGMDSSKNEKGTIERRKQTIHSTAVQRLLLCLVRLIALVLLNDEKGKDLAA